jgi:hypothetical protein
VAPLLALACRNHDGTVGMLQLGLRLSGQVTGGHLQRKTPVCKTVGSAYVGSNPTPATSKTPGHSVVGAAQGERSEQTAGLAQVSSTQHLPPGCENSP